MQAKDINKILGIEESFKMPEKLLSILLSDEAHEYYKKFLSLGESLDHDWFTAYFEEEHSNKTKMAQDFTPDAVCKLLSQIVGDADTFADVCAGTGGLTIGMWNNYKNAKVVCYEYSERAIPLLLFNLAIRNIDGIVIRCDLLTGEEFDYYEIMQGQEFSTIKKIDKWEPIQVDAVVSNPPYSMKYKPKEDTRFPDIADILPTNYADYVFIAFALKILKENGRAGFILPHGVLFRASKEAKMRQYLIDKNIIRTVIGLPGNLFLNTAIPTLIMELQKGRSDDDILIIDAKEKAEKAKKINVMTDKHIGEILDAYKNRTTMEHFATLVSRQETIDNGYNLNITRYVDTYIPEPPINLVDLAWELEQAKLNEEISLIEINNTLLDTYATSPELVSDYDKARMMFMGLPFGVYASPQMDLATNYYKLTDIADIERAKKDEIYPAGTVYVQVSATSGQVHCLEEPGTIETKYATVIPKDSKRFYPAYFKLVLESGMDEFLARYKSTLNIQIPDFKFFEVLIYEDYNTQAYISELFLAIDRHIEAEEQWLNMAKDMKKASEQYMFCDGDEGEPGIRHNGGEPLDDENTYDATS